ncbi:MAG: type II secretion system ATPase GspE, partial [Deltaproteobacteria bacterium]|nr:type II secretion system ATPase GspE [Deltaproteobacteria bacterium]
MSNPWDKSAKTVVAHKDEIAKKVRKGDSTPKLTPIEQRELDDEVTEVIEKTISKLNVIKSEDFVKSVEQDYELKSPSDNTIGQILLGISNLDPRILQEAIEQTSVDETQITEIGEYLIKKKAITEEELIQALSLQTGIPVAQKLDEIEIDLTLITKIPISFAKKHNLVPFMKKGNTVYVAISNPTDLSPIDDLRVLTHANIKPMLASKTAILNIINKTYDKSSGVGEELQQDLMDDLENQDLDNVNLDETQDLLDSDDEAPIIRLINTLLFRAVKERASDIHIEPLEKEIAVRFRIDGVLYEIMKLPKKAKASITSRIKIMADLDIAEKRIPQDGRIKIKIGGRGVDIRLSTLPASYGESIVMRLLVTSNVVPQLDDIGFDEKQLQIIKRVTKLSHGIFLVTGPTGSGKSTTLYTCLSSMNSKDRKIITVENPVERQLDNVMQVQVNDKVNLTFASGLRSILRQDPDVIMIGEIRDLETAEIAIQASLTGHLVFSTLHTNDSAGSITRLIDMGVEPFLVASSLVGSMAQRLVRTFCDECKQVYQPSDFELKEIGIAKEIAQAHTFYKPVGCEECAHTGYAGRMGIYEMMPVDDRIRALVSKNVDAGQIRKEAKEQGVKFLRADGSEKVLQGLTSI